MRRLMSGYAVIFNRRHRRAGHLFQNRYKSVICEEDPYLLELIRYIHLNPLRAGLVKDLKELDRYPWTGHSAILGRRKSPLIPTQAAKENQPDKPEEPEKPLAEKTIEDLFLHFGGTVREARRSYRNFVKKGIDQGTRPELQGGGLVRPACHRETRIPGNFRKHNESDRRSYSWNNACKARAGRSAGGDKRGLLGRKREERPACHARHRRGPNRKTSTQIEDCGSNLDKAGKARAGRELSDERILGSGDFVANVMKDANEVLDQRAKFDISLVTDFRASFNRHINIRFSV